MEISEEEMRSLTESILVRYGVDFTCYEPKSLRRRIVRVMALYELASVHDLWVKLLHDSKFIFAFMNEVSVGMTSMFRDPILWRKLKTKLHTQFREHDRIDIWHAGCSTGEEVYSLGIVLKEVQLLHKARAVASDMNQDALLVAQKGIYHKLKMIENDKNYREYNSFSELGKYYSPEDGKHDRMSPELINHVKFTFHNLITEKPPGTFDIILCRNVMIYFDQQAKEKLMEKFYQALKPGGYFIIGFYDTMLPILHQKSLSVVDEDAKIFSRPAA